MAPRKRLSKTAPKQHQKDSSASSDRTPLDASKRVVEQSGKLQTSPTLFENGQTDPMATALPILEASNILTQRNDLRWADDANGKLCYARQVGEGAGKIYFWVTDDIADEHPSTLAGAAALACIDTFDIRAACMHLIYAAYAARLDKPWEKEFVIDDSQIEKYLGLTKRSDLNKTQRLQLIKQIAEQPCKITTYISWPQTRTPKFTIAEGRLWHLIETQYHYQKDLFGNNEPTGVTFVVRPGHWARYFLNKEGSRSRSAYYQSGTLPQSILEGVTSAWYHREGAARLMVWMLFKAKSNRKCPINVRMLLEIAYGTSNIQEATNNNALRKKLANNWDEDLLILHEHGWKITFDPESYPSDIRPPAFGRSAQLRPRGYFDKLLKAQIWVQLPDKWSRSTLSRPDEAELLLESDQIPPTPTEAQAILTGTEVKTLRKARHWNQTKLSKLSGISQSMISYIENEERPITPDLEVRLRQALEQPSS